MSQFVEVKTAELIGPALDWAVANATKAWEFAHEWFPTMTLDPHFIGTRNAAFDGCVWLEPRNPFRQDPQPFRPSTDWAQGGPLRDKHKVDITEGDHDVSASILTESCECVDASGPTALVAICRAIVSAKLGDVVQVPSELMGEIS